MYSMPRYFPASPRALPRSNKSRISSVIFTLRILAGRRLIGISVASSIAAERWRLALTFGVPAVPICRNCEGPRRGTQDHQDGNAGYRPPINFSPLQDHGHRAGAEPRTLLHPRRKSGEQRHGRGLRQNAQRDYVRVSPIGDAAAALTQIDRWMKDYNTVHPHSRLGYRSPREYINAKSQSTACPV